MRASIEDLVITVGITSSVAFFALLLNLSPTPKTGPDRPLARCAEPAPRDSLKAATSKDLRDSLAIAARVDSAAGRTSSNSRCPAGGAPAR